MEATLLRPSDPSDPVAAARAFISNPGAFLPRLDADEWADLQKTSWAVLRGLRPARPAGICTVTVIPRAVFEAHARPRRPLPPLMAPPGSGPGQAPTPGDAA